MRWVSALVLLEVHAFTGFVTSFTGVSVGSSDWLCSCVGGLSITGLSVRLSRLSK